MLMSEVTLSSDFVITVADILGEANKRFILPRFASLARQDISQKSSATDFVTIADIEAETYILERLRALTPSAQFLAEEQSSGKEPVSALPSGLVWTVDPLDGTRNFVHEKSDFCSMVSLISEGVTVAAWIYRSLDKECLIATLDDGLGWVRDASITWFPAPAPVAGDFLSLRGTANAMGLAEPLRAQARQKLKSHPGRYHIGSAGCDAVAAVSGQSQFVMHSKLTPWDSTPAAMMCRTAGFTVALAPDKSSFTPLSTGALLMTQNEGLWDECADFVFASRTD